MAGAVALASTGYIAAIDEKAGRGHVGSAPGVQGSPQREPALPRRQLREQSNARRKVESSFWSGGWIASPVAAAGGQAVVRRTVPLRSLDDWLVPACYQ